MGQRFYANIKSKFEFSNGAIGYGSGSCFDCLGPYAKVKNCPIKGMDIRLTCYASGYPDTCFSIPANTRYKGKYVSGFFTCSDDGRSIEFVPHKKYDHFFNK